MCVCVCVFTFWTFYLFRECNLVLSNRYIKRKCRGGSYTASGTGATWRDEIFSTPPTGFELSAMTAV
jgi:hypothetical protein